MNRQVKSTINEASKDLLLKLLRSAGLTKVQSKIYLGKHRHSLDTYLYRFFEPNFPPSFAYFFLNAIASSRPLSKDSKSKSKKYAFFDDLKNAEKNSFHKIIEKYKDFNINQKLILPCLEYHCTIHIKLSNSKFIHDEENYVKRYVDEVLPGLREEVEEIKNYQPDEPETNTNNLSEVIRLLDAQRLIESIEDFYPHLEILRKKYMPNFVAPNETFKLPVVNSNEKILFSKDFVKRNLNLNKYDDLILLNVSEDNMQGTINSGDIALIIKFHNKKFKDVVFNNGIYAINLNGRICVRRLQFLKLKQRTLVHIISDNKKYRDDAIDFVELIPMIYGEVVWRSNNFKDIEFLKHETIEPNLFHEKAKDIEIPLFIDKNKKEIA